MSVILLPDQHISLLASAAVVFRQIPAWEGEVMYATLRDANLRAFCERYYEEETNYTFSPFEFVPITDIYGLKIAVESYLYQTDGVSEYDGSDAETYVNGLLKRVTAALAGYEPEPDEYLTGVTYWHVYTGKEVA